MVHLKKGLKIFVIFKLLLYLFKWLDLVLSDTGLSLVQIL